MNEMKNMAAPAAVAVPDERAAFEQWANKHYSSINLTRDDEGYRHSLASEWWDAWQARAEADAQIQSQANAWFACCDALEEVKPGFMMKEGSGVNCAVEAIKELSSQPAATPVVMPEPDAAVSELMGLVKAYTKEALNYYGFENGESTAESMNSAWIAIQSKLRALLAGVSAPAALAVERGEVLVTVSGFTGSGKSAIAGEIEIMCRALGLQVEWPDSDSEKHMTHADWIAALEQYKPRVRIVECNVPHSVVKGQDK